MPDSPELLALAALVEKMERTLDDIERAARRHSPPPAPHGGINPSQTVAAIVADLELDEALAEAIRRRH